MQGQRSAVGSLPETIGFDQGSSSSDAAMDQQLCWNNMQNSANSMLPNFIASTNDPANAYLNQRHTLNGWNMGEPSSHVTLNHVSQNNERKTEHGAGSASAERPYELASTLLLNSANVNRLSNQIPDAPFFVQSSNNGIHQDLNASAGFLGPGDDDDDCQIMESNSAYKSDMLENSRFQSAGSSSHPFGMPTGSGGYLAGESDGTPSSLLEGRHISRKRKAMEGNTGQSSMSGNSTYFQPSDKSTLWNAVPGRYNAGTSLSISTPSPNVPLEILGGGGASSGNPLSLNMTGNGENPHRNYRVRINPSRRQDSVPVPVFPNASTVRHSNVSSQQQSSRFLPIGNSFDNTNPQLPSGVGHVPPPSRRSSQSSRWSSGSSSRAGERDAILPEDPNSITMPRNISEHPIFVPPHEVRNSPQNSGNWNLTGGNISIAGNVASSQTGSSSGVHPLPGPSWVPHRNPPRYPRRLQEFFRRSLLSSAGSESVDPSSGNSAVQLGSSSREMGVSSGNGNQGHHLPHSRSSLSLHRQLDGAPGVPYSFRTLAAAGEGRSRLVSEIRSVLDLMRRGEGLRVEDVMILDPSVFFGMPDIHDRHRDMRLDVDNMSYEELLALEDRIGNVSTGLSEDTITDHLKQRKYFSIAMSAHLEVEPCCVCQEEYKDGEDIGTLECGHEFHSGCIKQWLLLKNLCPICKTTALNK